MPLHDKESTVGLLFATHATASDTAQLVNVTKLVDNNASAYHETQTRLHTVLQENSHFDYVLFGEVHETGGSQKGDPCYYILYFKTMVPEMWSTALLILEKILLKQAK